MSNGSVQTVIGENTKECENCKRVRRESFEQAAEMVDELRPNLIGQASQSARQLSQKLRQLAEGI